MIKRYKPTGTPLTLYEREVLEILQEECAEVIQAASKLLRFGKENRPPERAEPNTVVLAHEVGDLRYMIWLTLTAEIISPRDVREGERRKQARLKKYMQHEPD